MSAVPPQLHAALIGLLALLAAPAVAIVHSEVGVDGRIHRLLAADLDGDGRRDLLVVHVDGRGRGARRSVSLFWQREAPRFLPRPDLTWELPASETALDVVERAEGEAGAETLFSLRDDGVYRYRFERGRGSFAVELVVRAELEPLVAETDSVLVMDFAQLWQGGELVFLVPTLLEPTLLRRCADGYRRLTVPVRSVASYTVGGNAGRDRREFVARYRLLQPLAADQDGDGALELVAYDQERVLIVELPPAQDCAGAPVLAGVHPVEVLQGDSQDRERFELRPRLADLEGDGRLELVVTAFREAGLFELDGQVMVFRGRADGSFPARADQKLAIENGQYYLTSLEDLDGDGRLEIVLPSARIGVWGFIKLLTRRKVSFELQAFRLTRSGAFGAQRTVLTSTNALVSDSYGLSAITLTDVTGDGVSDLVMGTSDERLCLRRGLAAPGGWRLAPRGRSCFPGDPFARHQTADLDLDGRPELLEMNSGPGGRGRARVTWFGDSD